MPQLEAHEKVLVAEAFLDDPHYKTFFRSSCTECHGGVEPAETRAEAHQGMAAAPSRPDGEICITCHADETHAYRSSLHSQNRGIYDPEHSQIARRADPNQMDQLSVSLKDHCGKCHTVACGDCHISRSHFNGKGFIKGHVFFKTPKATKNCTGCHGSRVEKEMLAKGGLDKDGQEVSTSYDVHWNPNMMTCEACHGGHRDQTGVNYRYDDPQAVRCEDCHEDALADAENAMHAAHADPESGTPLLQCQVCHSQPYNNCSGCHVKRTQSNESYFIVDASWFTFKIARNYLKSESRPYDYILARHVPVARDTFAVDGEDLLSNFDTVPTWKYATPHNIQRISLSGGVVNLPAHVQDCNDCHGHSELFLTEGDVDLDERIANEPVIVTDVPAPI